MLVETVQNIALHGFRAGTLAKALKRGRFTDKMPGRFGMKDVVALPERTALYDLDGNRIDVSRLFTLPDHASPAAVEKWERRARHLEPAKITVPSDLEVCSDPVMFGGTPMDHYGHHLTDGMSRLWPDDPRTRVFLPARWRETTFGNWMIKQGERPHFFVQKPTLFRNIIIPQSSFQFGWRAYPAHAREHVSIAHRVLPHTKETPKKVFLSRSRMHLRQSADEGRLLALLERHGFQAVSPESLSMPDQISIFNAADVIVGAAGSAFHTSLFSLPGYGGKLAILSLPKLNTRFTQIDQMKSHQANYIQCVDVSETDSDGRAVSTSIDTAKAMDVLSSIGALT